VCNGASAVDTATLTPRPIRPNGTFKIQVNENGLYVFGIPLPILPTDTFDLKITGPSGTTYNNRTADSLSNTYKNLQLFENGFGANILDIRKQSTAPGEIYGILKFDSNASESLVAQVDTTGLKGTDWAVNAKLLSGYNPGASGTVRLTSPGAIDTIIPFTITESQGMGIYMAETIILKPQTGISKGLETELKNKLIIVPSIVNANNHYIYFDKHFKGFLYNSTGQKVSSIDADKLDVRNLGQCFNSIYFFIDDEDNYKGKINFVK